MKGMRINKNNCLIRRLLLFPEQKPNVAKYDKLALAVPHKIVNSFKINLRKSRWNASDQRDKKNIIGFTNKGLNANKLILENIIWNKVLPVQKITLLILIITILKL